MHERPSSSWRQLPRRIHFVDEERACVRQAIALFIIKSPSEPNLRTKCTRTPIPAKRNKKKKGKGDDAVVNKCQSSQSLSPFFSQQGSRLIVFELTILVFEKQGPYTKERYPITAMKLQSERSITHCWFLAIAARAGFWDAGHSIDGMEWHRPETHAKVPTHHLHKDEPH